MIPLWNVYSFFVGYARLDKWTPGEQATVNGGQFIVNREQSSVAAHVMMDNWIVERLHEATLATRAALDVYDSEKATQVLEAYLDDLSNWYVRRSRRRFWKSEGDADKHAAYATLYHVLVEFVKLIAPIVPFTAEAIYQNLVASVDESAPKSVHHCFYPQADAANLDQRLLEKMGLAITTASLGRAARGRRILSYVSRWPRRG
ncbi:MAG: class I tRNA ligase family protein [Chloroflexi bacterium]|nr:class I tRNA ligase family protein [Chloroflexota bacterium]